MDILIKYRYIIEYFIILRLPLHVPPLMCYPVHLVPYISWKQLDHISIAPPSASPLDRLIQHLHLRSTSLKHPLWSP